MPPLARAHTHMHADVCVEAHVTASVMRTVFSCTMTFWSSRHGNTEHVLTIGADRKKKVITGTHDCSSSFKLSGAKAEWSPRQLPPSYLDWLLLTCRWCAYAATSVLSAHISASVTSKHFWACLERRSVASASNWKQTKGDHFRRPFTYDRSPHPCEVNVHSISHECAIVIW